MTERLGRLALAPLLLAASCSGQLFDDAPRGRRAEIAARALGGPRVEAAASVAAPVVTPTPAPSRALPPPPLPQEPRVERTPQPRQARRQRTPLPLRADLRRTPHAERRVEAPIEIPVAAAGAIPIETPIEIPVEVPLAAPIDPLVEVAAEVPVELPVDVAVAPPAALPAPLPRAVRPAAPAAATPSARERVAAARVEAPQSPPGVAFPSGEAAAVALLEALQSGETDGALALYAPSFFNDVPRGRWLATLRSVDRKLGALERWEVVDSDAWSQPAKTGAGDYQEIVFFTHYAKDSATETITTHRPAGERGFRVIGHWIDSRHLEAQPDGGYR